MLGIIPQVKLQKKNLKLLLCSFFLNFTCVFWVPPTYPDPDPNGEKLGRGTGSEL